VVIKKENAFYVEKHGVNMWIYNGKEQCEEAAVVYQETRKGHLEEFYHSKSVFLFYIIEGKGNWYINGEEQPVETGDLLIVPKNSKFYYKGQFKQICITAPAWEQEFEHHVSMIPE
jgi:mannose-6-phosphate isomerase-like protein (cupin superfamily)